jgi:hypothetical protein
MLSKVTSNWQLPLCRLLLRLLLLLLGVSTSEESVCQGR